VIAAIKGSGFYVISGLSANSTYEVTVEATGYISESMKQVRIGDKISFSLERK
jgi:hypothetical protein